jgi:GWxTD domain-containing protein
MEGRASANKLEITQIPHFEEFVLSTEGSGTQLGVLMSIPYSQLDFQWSSDRSLYIADAELVFGLVSAESISSLDDQSETNLRRWWSNRKESNEDLLNRLEDSPIDTTFTITLTTNSLERIQDSVHTQGIVWTLPNTYFNDSYGVRAMLYSGNKQRPMRSRPKTLSANRSIVYPVVEQDQLYCAQSIRAALAYNTNAKLLWLKSSTKETENERAEAQFFTASEVSMSDKDNSRPSAQPLLPSLDVVAHPTSIIDEKAFSSGQLCVPKQDQWVSETFDGTLLPNETLAIRIADERFTWQSIWENMPRSLRNIDIAIQALKFIEEEEIVDELMDGSTSDKKTSFFDYWTPKDPTDDSHYNELMVEFYRRVDQAAKEFSSPSLELLESDQAKVFIRYGEPDSKTREFPPDGNTQEIWRYGQTEFLFEASSGFGDFVLVSPRSL